ncbi:MAG: pentapeptide repeat-containing protein [Leptolyngbya sp. SIO1E4]|nr:pentapeptide repeat-containing protein [Leptolyngbya sp. SIO1E4]
MSVPTLKRFWRRTAITQESFVLICQALDLDWQEITDLGSANLEDLIHQGVDVWNEWKHNHPPQGYNLAHMDLRGMDLQGADLSNTSLAGSNFSSCKLNGASLAGADLTNANFNSADLREANLSATQAIGTIFTGAMFTGACIENWNINADTHLENITCTYVYLQAPKGERRPRQGIFKPGEFTALFRQAIETVDLIFKDGIDWQAFFQSFQALRSQYADQDISIQAIERKGEAFIVRLAVPDGADDKTVGNQAKRLYRANQDKSSNNELKQEIEAAVRELYETKLMLMEQRYRDVLQAKDSEISAYREQSTNLLKVTELLASNPMPSKPNQMFYGPVGNVASSGGQISISSYPQQQVSLAEAAAEIQNLLKQLETSNPTATETDQTNFLNSMIPSTHRQPLIDALRSSDSATIDKIPYGSVLKALVEGWQKSNFNEISRILSTLNNQAQALPTDQKDEANDVLDDLERDLQEKQPDSKRISRRLKRLAALATIVTGIATATSTKKDSEITDFANNILDLSNKLGIPIGQVQSMQLPPAETTQSKTT